MKCTVTRVPGAGGGCRGPDAIARRRTAALSEAIVASASRCGMGRGEFEVSGRELRCTQSGAQASRSGEIRDAVHGNCRVRDMVRDTFRSMDAHVAKYLVSSAKNGDERSRWCAPVAPAPLPRTPRDLGSGRAGSSSIERRVTPERLTGSPRARGFPLATRRRLIQLGDAIECSTWKRPSGRNPEVEDETHCRRPRGSRRARIGQRGRRPRAPGRKLQGHSRAVRVDPGRGRRRSTWRLDLGRTGRL